MNHAIEGEQDRAIIHANDLVQQGLSLRVLYIDVLSVVARRLGEMWEEDTLHFVSVTTALHVLQAVLRDVRGPVISPNTEGDHTRRLVLCRANDDQHTFGLLTLTRFFEDSGWDVIGGTELECGPELISLLSDEWYSLVGVSIGSNGNLRKVAEVLPAVRNASKNPMISIMVGGPVFADGARTAEECGADIYALNGELAVEEAEALIE